MDDHSGWDDIPEEQREYVEGKVRAIVESAVQAADQQSNGWGNIPANIRDEIRRSISTIIPWQAVLKQFVGTLNPGGRTTSIKRINRRYPYIHPGVKRARAPKLLIAIDESGSVGNEMLQMFFGELSTLTRKMDITLVPFDCDCRVEDCTEWRRGQPAPVAREKCGGTSFDAPTRMANDPKNRGRWDGMLIMTDGECSEPGPSRMKRGWVLGKGQKLYFDSNELQIFLDDAKPMTGAWR
jgi:predicted metal-dependent peptidase